MTTELRISRKENLMIIEEINKNNNVELCAIDFNPDNGCILTIAGGTKLDAVGRSWYFFEIKEESEEER